MVSRCCNLHPELEASISHTAHAHDLWVEDVGLGEIAGHQLMKPV